MDLIEWLVSAFSCTLKADDWSVPDQNGVSLQPGPTCTCRAAEMYVRYISQCDFLPPCTPERTQHHQLTTWPFWQLEASMIITCNYSKFQIYSSCTYIYPPIYIYIYMYVYIYIYVIFTYMSTRPQYISTAVFLQYIEKLWKNSEMMKIGGLCQTHIHLYPLSLQGCKTCLSGLRRSNSCWVPFSSSESYVALVTNPASIEDVWHLLFLEMRWGLLYNEKGSGLGSWSYLGTIEWIVAFAPWHGNVHPGCYWSSKSCCNATGSSNGGIVTCVDIITWCSAPNYPKFHTFRPNANISWNVVSVFSRDFLT